MSLDVGTIRAGVQADLRDIDQGLKGLIEALKKLEAGAKGVSPALDDSADEMTDTGREAEKASKQVKDFDVSLASLQAKARSAASALRETTTAAKEMATPAIPAAVKTWEPPLKEAGQAATETARRVSQAGKAIEETSRKAVPLQRRLASVAQGMSTVAGAAGSATGKLGSFATSMIGIFGSGGLLAGGIGVGIGLVASGLGTLVSRMQEAARESRQLDALHDILGVASGEVDKLRQRFRDLGADIDQRVAVQIMRAGREAGIATREISEMAAEIARLGDLMGGDFSGAASRVFSDMAQRSRELREGMHAVRDALAELETGEAYDLTLQRGERVLELLQDQERNAEALIEQRREELRIAEEAWKTAQARRDAEALTPSQAAARLREAEAELESIRQQIEAEEDLLVRYQLAKDAAGQARKAEEDRARAIREAAALAERRMEASLALENQARVIQAQLANDRRAELTALAEEEIRLQRRAVEQRMLSEEAFAQWEVARREQLARDLAAIDAEVEAEHRERLRAIEELRVEASGDQVALARFTAEQEIEAEKEKVDGIRYTWEEFYAWREAREAKLQADISRIRAAEAKANRKEREAARRELERKIADEEKMQVAGINAGTSFVAGFRRAIESSDPEALFSALFTGIGGILSVVPGGQVAGAVFGGIGRIFHEGGVVGEDGRQIPRYHDGGMIVAHRGMLIPEPGPGEVPILAQTGEGILSRKGVAAAGGPAAVRAFNEGRPPPAQVVAGPTVYIQAFDPQSTQEALARVWEPAQYRRGMSRQDGRVAAMLRRRVSQPRSGR